MDAEPTDEQLMVSYAGGDAGAFETLYLRHKGPLYRYFLRQCGDAATSEELYQDVWIKVIGARRKYRVSAKFTTYLYTLAHNRMIDFYRHQARRLPSSYSDNEQEAIEAIEARAQDQPEIRSSLQEQAERLLALIDALPEAQREVFLLRKEAVLSIDEIAEATDVNREAVKSRLRYAVAKLRAGMQAV
jgi:RNA polymerase sigma-70 factor (ECF subfamily)